MEKLKTDYWRQLDFYTPNTDSKKVLIIGAGAIGSYATFGLARLGVKHITVVDHDKVAHHNLPNQFFSESEELTDEIYKVFALKQSVEKMVKGATINPIPLRIEAFTESDEFSANSYDVIIVAVDNMEVRSWIWDFFKQRSGVKLFIDARIGGQFANIYAITLASEKAKRVYGESLYSDTEVPELPCSGQSIVDVSLSVAGGIVQAYRHFHKSKLKTIHTFYDFVTPQAYGQEFYTDSEVIHDSVVEANTR